MANLIGETLLKQFRVDAFIASGGMGAVYRVWDLKRNVPLAMKVLHGELAEDPSVFKRFQREANALKKLAHPHIVPFYGLYQTLDFAFLLERFIDGPSLKEIIKERKKDPFLIQEALVFIKALAAALGYAHANGVVHCDVKPGNVMIDQGGNIYLTDFGVARHADSSTTTLGGAGTPAYMPPEQILGKAVTASSDIYSLGAILFEMLTGQRPFRGYESGTERSGETVHERIRYAHLHTPPPDPRTINPSIPESLSKIILKSLDKNPASRYSSTMGFLSAICESMGLDPGDIVDRVGTSNIRREAQPPSDAPEVNKTQWAKAEPFIDKIKGLPSWQVIGAIAVSIVVCVLLAVQAFSPPFSSYVLVTQTSTSRPISDTIITNTPKPTATLISGSIPISVNNLELIKNIYSWPIGEEVVSVAFSPDGEYLATGEKLGNVKVWRIREGKVKFELPGSYVSFSPDGKLLGVAGNSGIYLYDASNGKLLRTIDNKKPFFSVQFSPDSRLIAGGASYGFYFVWRTSDGVLHKTGGELGGDVQSLSFSQDGYLLAAASSSRTYIWNMEQDRMERNLGIRRKRPDYLSVALDDDGEWYATGHNNGEIYFWRVSNAEQIGIVTDGSQYVNKLEFFHGTNSPELLVSGGEAALSFWVLDEYDIVNYSISTASPMLSLAISPNNNLIATSNLDGMIQFWGVVP